MSKQKESTTERISPQQYEEYFKGKEKEALERALDIRKFEIDLYWKRATYFWTFIGATFAGYLGVQASSSEYKLDLSVILSCLGIVFSFAWFLVNRGSKYWQENWEKHVDALEDKIHGPLYKVVLSRNTDDFNKREKVKDWITGPSAISVSKINQLISLYVFLVWFVLLIYSLPPIRFASEINWLYFWLVGLTAIACISFVTPLSKTYQGGYWHNADLRKSRIKPANNQIQPTPESGAAD